MNKKVLKLNSALFASNLDRFISNIRSLKQSLHLTMGLINVQDNLNLNRLADFIKNNAVEKTKKTFSIKRENIDYYEKLKREIDTVQISYKVVPRSSLISLISQFDAFIGSTIGIILNLQPGLMQACEKNLTYKTLSNLKTIEDAKKYITEKEIESVLRESHTYHFEWLEKTLSMTLRKDLSIWPQFIELTERRNLFAHNGGLVSSQYLSVCKENGISLSNGLKSGDEFDVTPQYFDASYKCLYELSVKLTHVLWRKLLPDSREDADFELNKVCYEIIERKSYALGEALLKFATEDLKKYSSETYRNIFIINRALAKKLNGDKKTAQKLIGSVDWSASSNDFKLAKEVLMDNRNEVYSLMKKIGEKGEIIDKDSYRTWPLFSEIREDRKFKETFKLIYDENLNKSINRLEYDVKLTVKPRKKGAKKSTKTLKR